MEVLSLVDLQKKIGFLSLLLRSDIFSQYLFIKQTAFLHLKKKPNVFIWLVWVLVAACRISVVTDELSRCGSGRSRPARHVQSGSLTRGRTWAPHIESLEP